ncbi:MAG: TetR family transcriptional regulator [Arthrobacter sp.]|jgi:AcrR family transcriptional regulator|nr:TetR family transcriptional regulator [Arthrobacter sp.]
MSTTASAKRGRLDRETIVAAGLEITARSGVKALSVRELGQLLGADPTAIYRHVRNKDELVLAMLDHLEARAVEAVTAPPEEWEERLRQLGEATVELFAAHPAVGVEAIVATTHGPGERAAVEMILAAFQEAGLDDAGVVRHYSLFAQHMMACSAGIARSITEHGGNGRLGPWFDTVPTADPAVHPLLARYAAQLGELQDLDLFRRGRELITESARREGAERRAAL